MLIWTDDLTFALGICIDYLPHQRPILMLNEWKMNCNISTHGKTFNLRFVLINIRSSVENREWSQYKVLKEQHLPIIASHCGPN